VNVSTYTYVLNNPVLMIDPTGMESEAYGSVGTLEKYKQQYAQQQEKAQEERKEKQKGGNQSVINVVSASKNSDNLVNGSIGHLIKYLSDAGISAKVKFSRSDQEFDITQINNLDAVAVIGDKKSTTVSYILDNLDKGYLSSNFKTLLKEDYLRTPASQHPEKADGYGSGNWGYVVAVTVNPYGDSSGKLTTNSGIGTFEEATAFFVLHGLGHLGGMGHGWGSNDFGYMSEGRRLRNEIRALNGDLRSLIRNTVTDPHNVMDSIYKRFPK
jgi:hypothetical protein